VKSLFVNSLLWSGRFLVSVANHFRLSDSNKRWFRDRGNETLRLDYDELNEESVVFDVGGYQGQWASDIYSKYRSRIHIFEAVPDYASLIGKRFEKNSSIVVHPFGLSGASKTIQIAVDADGSSGFRSAHDAVQGKLVDVAEFIAQHSLQKIDLMKINIEGGEYELLERLIQTGDIEKIVNVQVQFHDFVPDARTRMNKIQSQLSKTHFLTYQYEFIFENWKRR
jgi:FkbM family methyltransferase